MKELIMSIFAQFGILFPVAVIFTYASTKYFTDKDLINKIVSIPSVSIIMITITIAAMVINVWFGIEGSTTSPILVKSWIDFIIFSLFMTGLSVSAVGVSKITELPEKVTGIISDLLLLIVSILTIPVSSDLVSFLRSVL